MGLDRSEGGGHRLEQAGACDLPRAGDIVAFFACSFIMCVFVVLLIA